jgi:hypothetical protein
VHEEDLPLVVDAITNRANPQLPLGSLEPFDLGNVLALAKLSSGSRFHLKIGNRLSDHWPEHPSHPYGLPQFPRPNAALELAKCKNHAVRVHCSSDSGMQ